MKFSYLQAMVDKLKGISSSATLVTTKHGHLHLEVAAMNVHLAAELQGLNVLPADTPQTAQPLAYAPAACMITAVSLSWREWPTTQAHCTAASLGPQHQMQPVIAVC